MSSRGTVLIGSVLQEFLAPSPDAILIFAAQGKHDFILCEFRAFLAEVSNLSAMPKNRTRKANYGLCIDYKTSFHVMRYNYRILQRWAIHIKKSILYTIYRYSKISVQNIQYTYTLRTLENIQYTIYFCLKKYI